MNRNPESKQKQSEGNIRVKDLKVKHFIDNFKKNKMSKVKTKPNYKSSYTRNIVLPQNVTLGIHALEKQHLMDCNDLKVSLFCFYLNSSIAFLRSIINKAQTVVQMNLCV